MAVWLACSAAADTLITGSLVWHLVSFLLDQSGRLVTDLLAKRKHKSGFGGTDDAVDRIIRRTSYVIARQDM